MKKLKKHEKKENFHTKKGEFDHKIYKESKKVGPISLRAVLFEKIGLFLMRSGEKRVKNHHPLADPKNPRICLIELAVAPDTG